MFNPFVSIIVRTKNEDFWIGKCLNEIFNQQYQNFEVILVDNNSKDKTINIVKKLSKSKNYNLQIKNPFTRQSSKFRNKKSKGHLIAMISGHCIPKNDKWLGTLVKNFKNSSVIAAMVDKNHLIFQSQMTKRDLMYLFGLR